MTALKRVTKYNNRKFYNRYLYKISLEIKGITALRSVSPEKFLEIDFLSDSVYHRTYWFSHCVDNRELIDRVCRFLIKHNSSDIHKRLERNQIDFYTNDKNLYDRLSIEFIDVIRLRSEPKLDLGISDAILVKKLPHNKFKYKVFLKPHTIRDKETKIKYLEWLQMQTQTISISNTVKSWFLFTDWNWDRRYIWVTDEQTLLMLKLRNTEVVGTIHTYQVIE